MNEKVVELDAHRPHAAGVARCMGCGYEWAAVAPVGTSQLECPECRTMKGVFKYPFEPQTSWTCECGNRLFSVVPAGVLCPGCGAMQKFD